MFTLWLNASPHAQGDSATLAELALQEIPGEKLRLDLYPPKVEPCRDCGDCRAGEACQLDATDAMGHIRERLHQADNLLLSSPLHFFSLSAPLVALASRLEPEWFVWRQTRKPAPDKRRAALVVTAGGDYPDMFQAARLVASAFFRIAGFTQAEGVEVAGTDRRPPRENPEARKRAVETGRRLAGVTPLPPPD
ncbi:MAG: NAD(P)H-dependent oxidoreductase [Planctomycetota bacterium]|nr:NAD(P)H-dependent oxidoreductase [Planctomycetota bacterium]